jgi:hypothetical protein
MLTRPDILVQKFMWQISWFIYHTLILLKYCDSFYVLIEWAETTWLKFYMRVGWNNLAEVLYVGNKRNLVTHKLIPTMRKRTTIRTIGVWFITSTTIWCKLKLSGASNSRNIRTNNIERIDILIVGLSTEIHKHRRHRGKKMFSEQSRWRFSKTLYASYPM